MKERITSLVKTGAEYVAGKALWETTRIVRFIVDDPNGNFIAARDALESGYSLITYTNHFDQFDPVIAARFADRYLTTLDHVWGVAGLKHYDQNRGLNSKFTKNATSLIQEYGGLGLILVVQGYDMDSYPNPSPATDNLTAQAFNLRSMRQTLDVVRSPGEVLFIAPEGTRQKDGVLSAPQVDTASLLKASRGTGLALPLAIVPPERLKIRPILDNVTVRPGIPFSHEELMKENSQNPDRTPTDLMMMRLADSLPQKYKGSFAR